MQSIQFRQADSSRSKINKTGGNTLPENSKAQNVSPILRDEERSIGPEAEEASLSAPRAREIQGIRIRLEKLIKHITDASGLSEA